VDLTARQRKAAFALIVVVLGGLGGYMFVPRAAAGGSAAVPSHARPQPSAPAVAGPSASPGPAASPATSAPDIYQWLPFTRSDLATAAAVATEFSADYGTWSYSQNAAEYVASMGSLITPELSKFLAQGFSVPGVASLRASRKQVSVATATISALRAFGPSSITFVVTISQQITQARGRSQTTTQDAVTVTGAGGGWRVNDIELAAAGNS